MPNILAKDNLPAAAPLTVSQLTTMIGETLEKSFASVLVSGEISNWSPAASGHCYFSMKDEKALISCVLWRGSRQGLRFNPSEGMKVECRGRVGVYGARGQYQLVVERMAPAGMGDLYARFQELKEKLEREGLFSNARKRPLPRLPLRVGVVTSPTGAAIRDILSVLGRRAPGLDVLIHPARVQGEGAAAEITEGVKALAGSGQVDVLIVGRGGGSFEDLFCFNDEALARAIAASPIPVVSAVGHETDFSISDFVADLRAPTPSAAAEIVTREFADLLSRVRRDLSLAEQAIFGRLLDAKRRINGALASHALRQPELRVRELQQRADLAMRRLPELLDATLGAARQDVRRLLGSLEGHNPELILSKGYSIVRRASTRSVVQDAAALKRNMLISIQLRDGERSAVVTDSAADDLFA